MQLLSISVCIFYWIMLPWVSKTNVLNVEYQCASVWCPSQGPCRLIIQIQTWVVYEGAIQWRYNARHRHHLLQLMSLAVRCVYGHAAAATAGRRRKTAQRAVNRFRTINSTSNPKRWDKNRAQKSWGTASKLLNTESKVEWSALYHLSLFIARLRNSAQCRIHIVSLSASPSDRLKHSGTVSKRSDVSLPGGPMFSPNETLLRNSDEANANRWDKY